MKTNRLMACLHAWVRGVLPIVAPALVLAPQISRSVPPAGPTLDIHSTNHNALVSWSTSGFWLQASEDLSSPLDWYNAPWQVNNSGPQFSAAVPMDASARFFRLVESAFLPPPTGLTAQAGDNDMLVTWDTVSNAATYNLYFASEPGVTPGNYNSLSNGAVLQGVPQPQVILDSQTLLSGVRYYFVATAVDADGESSWSNEGSDVFGPHGQIHGSFFTTVASGFASNTVFVPGVLVSFVNVNDATVRASAVTDAAGKFIAALVPGGTYQMCWSAAGFASNCGAQLVTLSNNVVILNPQELQRPTNSATGVVFGDVKLRDGNVPVFGADLFGASLTTTVSLVNSTGRVIRAVSANAFGQYLITDAPISNFTLTATAEAASVSTNIDTSVTGEAKLVLPNTAPVIHSILPRWNGVVVDHAPTGAVVTLSVNASDAENDTLHYAWLGGPGAGGLVSMDTSNLTLTLPEANGLIKVFVEVSDGHGGYAQGQTFLNVEDQLTFNGFVQDTNGDAIVGALVTVNSAAVYTDTNGFFSADLPFGYGDFALNITAFGYAPFSKVVHDSDTGGIYELTSLGGICTNWTGSPMLFSDAAGTMVLLDTNSLQLSPGVPYVGPICVAITTYDPCANTPPFPAGNIAIDSFGDTNWITPQVTAFVMVTDGDGYPLTIDPNHPATMILPLGKTCAPLTNAPCVVPEWIWNPASGVWNFSGLATNQAGDCESGPFAGPMFQMGLQAVAQPANTVNVSIDTDRSINLPVILRVSSQAVPIEISEKTKGRLLAGIPVPANKPVSFELLSPKEAPNDYFTDPNNANTLRKDKDKTVIFKVAKTFTEDDSLTIGLSKHVPLLTDKRVSRSTHFLTYGDVETNIGPNITSGPVDVYYDTIGFPIQGSTFFKWLQKNGFINPPNGTFPKDYVEDAGALYFNATDLGFARSMHMKTRPGADGKMDIAYYVVNYRTMEDAAAQPTEDDKAVATVAMDYTATIRTNTAGKTVTNRMTKFYVFGFFDDGFGPNMGLRRNADLDGGGAKIVPNLCVTCHGTQPLTFTRPRGRRGWGITPANGDVKGYFIPFDLESFTYKRGAGVQQAQLRALNRGIYQHTPLTPAMKELIEGWYGGALNGANNNNFASRFVPAGWNANAAQKALYLDSVRVSCRGCHTMREDVPFNSFNNLNAWNGDAESLVCTQLRMPNAQRTFTIFWGSMAANAINNGAAPNQPVLLKNQFNWGPCPAPPP